MSRRSACPGASRAGQRPRRRHDGRAARSARWSAGSRRSASSRAGARARRANRRGSRWATADSARRAALAGLRLRHRCRRTDRLGRRGGRADGRSGAVLRAARPNERARASHQPLPAGGASTGRARPRSPATGAIDAAPRFVRSGRPLRRLSRAGSAARPPPTLAAPRAAIRRRPNAPVAPRAETPVNAIQGFAEVIQQQLFGPAPHEYRALAAAHRRRCRAHAGRLRRARPPRAARKRGADAGRGQRRPGAEIVGGLASQLGEVLRSRDAAFRVSVDAGPHPGRR